ncbi:MAG: sigma-54 dependent transcriptional regulator [Syntrophobacteraceae bacterium]|jgi:two-component system response regulator FlrC|nr:sigma-54 dependent transcriptional regulator [Syntrophobacteraceae bacterium]
MVVLITAMTSQDNQRIVSQLSKMGHSLHLAETHRAAVSFVGKAAPHVVLCNLAGQIGEARLLLDACNDLDDAIPVIVLSDPARLEDAVTLMKGGAYDFWAGPLDMERLVKTLQWLEERFAPSDSSGGDSSGHGDIITQSPHMNQLKAMVRKVAASSATVFLQGESGTGKELFARFIHGNSDRKTRPFVAINCAALPETLMESELFGYEKGAFTGAIHKKEGKFELAHTGTLFLDEVTEIPLHLQSKLLRVLQESEVDRVGGKKPVRVDVRVIASTNLSLEETVKSGQFRKDLYYRLNVIPIKIPTLRERPEDLTLLCRHFIDKYNRMHRCTVDGLDPQALKALKGHPWPGNVRELENIIQRAVLLAQKGKLAPEHLILEESPIEPGTEIDLMPISEMEKRLIFKALSSFSGNRTRAAEILGISVRTLRNKLHEYRNGGEPMVDVA